MYMQGEREREREREGGGGGEEDEVGNTHLNRWISTFNIKAEPRWRSIVEQHDTSKQVRGIP